MGLIERELLALGATELAKRADKLQYEGEGIFKPTSTTAYLLKAALESSDPFNTVLDLGCGWGILGLEIAIQAGMKSDLYLSDLSSNAVNATISNLINLEINGVAKLGSLFEPWVNCRFDLIVADVSGISELIPFRSKWFDKIPSSSGRDGLALTSRVIKEAPMHMYQNSCLIMPLISLSDTKKALNMMKMSFESVEEISSNNWKIEISDLKQKKTLYSLKKQEIVDFEHLDDVFYFNTKIYKLKYPKGVRNA